MRENEQNAFRLESEEKISTANRDAALALNEARSAEAKLASAEERAELARAEAANAHLQAAEANKIAKSFELRLEQQREATANAEIRATNAERLSQIAEASSRKAEEGTKEIKAGMRPRHISDAQRLQLLASLTNATKGTISVLPCFGDTEGDIYASQLRDILSQAGWTINTNSFATVLSVIGLQIAVKDIQRIPAHARSLHKSLLESGFSVELLAFTRLADNEVHLIVGTKP